MNALQVARFNNNHSLFILCFPGDAKRQHSVVYYHIKVNKSSADLQPQLILQEQEVSASAWFDKELIELANGQRDGFTNTKEISNNLKEKKIPKTFTIYRFKPDSNGVCELIEWPTRVLVLRIEDSGAECPDIERLSSGTIFALQEWLCSKNKSL